MDLKLYSRTRYQNIYKHNKNKNYIVMINKPVKTSIAKVNGKKIYKIEEAIAIRDNPKVKLQKKAEITYKEDFDTLWSKYIDYCKYEQKLAYNTIQRKQKTYNKYLKNKITKRIVKITKEEMAKFIDEQECSDKQKNQILKELRTFFNWCIKEQIIITSPLASTKKYKVEKPNMKFWIPEQLKKFIDTLNYDIDNNINKKTAYRTKIFTLIGFTLGDRTGETRALSFNNFKSDTITAEIKNSINYDRTDTNFTSHTKNYHSQRKIDITQKLIDEVQKYKEYLIEEENIDVKDTDLIFFNYTTKKPYSDTALRKYFYAYCEKAEVPKIRMYDLRHTYVATMMMEGKELYHISERLGHINYSTTVNKYGHLSNQVRKEIAEITDKYY